jgi:hydrogenase expression/formation protein HypE
MIAANAVDRPTAAPTASDTTLRWNRVLLAHGGGGQLTDGLLKSSVLPRLGNPLLDDLLDSALIDLPAGRVALTIDAYVVQPLRFPGGDIGRLAVCGTVNDLSVCGAVPAGVALSLILTEGLPRRELEAVIDSVAVASAEAGVKVVTGDTKVVGHGQGDGLYVITAGVGVVPSGRRLHPDRVREGDVILINGPIADHGLAVMLAREMPQVDSAVRSDAAPLNRLIEALLAATGDANVAFLRDPTRGGLAGVCADLARRAGRRIVLDEETIPMRPETRHAADMLGLDPLDVANEGKLVAVVRPEAAAPALDALRAHPLGVGAMAIGHVGAVDADGLCEIRTLMGGRRIVQKPYGEQLPRIC